MALGPHPQRELTLMLALGFAWPRASMAARAYSLALGPHPRRELTLMPRLGFPCPRLGMAAGAFSLALGAFLPFLPVPPFLPFLPSRPYLPFLPFPPYLPFSILIVLSSIRLMGVSSLRGAFSIASTAAIPSTTRPKAVY
jgi:hypothetical protein